MLNSKKIISLLLFLVMVLSSFCVVPVTISAAETNPSASGETSGTTGDCTWTLNGTVLTISGKGEMGDYSYDAPWGSEITEVNISNGVTNIGKCAFSNCADLTNINIPDSVTSIGENAFRDCSNLSEVTIPASVDYIGWRALGFCYDADKAETLVKPGFTIKGYKLSAAEDYASWEEIPFVSLGVSPYRYVNIQPGETKPTGELYSYDIAYYRFIPDEDMTVSFYSIGNHDQTQGFLFDEDLSQIDHNQWGGEGLNFKITYRLIAGNTYFFGASFVNSNSYGDFNVTLQKLTEWEYSVKEDGTAEIIKYNGNATDIEIPEKLDDYTITSIGYSAFSNCAELTRVSIPDSIKLIGSDAFKGCIGLKNITLPAALTEIDYCAFEDCSGLTEIEIPSLVTNIAYNAFYGCTKLAKIKIDERNKVYDSRNNCNAIIETETNELLTGCKNSIVPDSVTSIGFEAFRSCTGLTSIIIPDSVTEIGSSAFTGCTGLSDISIGNSVASIGWNAFSDCEVVDNITIPASVKRIESYTFSGCKGLTKVHIPKSVYYIGEGAFLHCDSLTSVTIPSSVSQIGTYAFGYDSDYDEINGFTIYGYSKTAAERYAEDNNFTFVCLNPTKVGDANGDGAVTSVDVTYIQRYCSKLEIDVDEDTIMNADVNGNGKLEIIDATLIQRYFAGIEIPFEVG